MDSYKLVIDSVKEITDNFNKCSTLIELLNLAQNSIIEIKSINNYENNNVVNLAIEIIIQIFFETIKSKFNFDHLMLSKIENLMF